MQRLPGFRDFYPEPLPTTDVWSADARQYVFDAWRATARLPEMTPTLARMAAAAERNYKKPFKWFAIPQLFRYEKQQKGRLREHFQLNADIIGEADVSADAELLALLIDTLRALNLTQDDFVIRLSSRNAWQEFFSKRCPDESKAYAFYQIVDKLEREERATSEAKLRELGFSFDEVTAFINSGEPTSELASILENLAARGLREFVKIDYGVIRGLAYYTGVVFEAFDKKGEFRAIAGGGRYNNLLKLVSAGKVDLPALGFGMGDVVLLELLKARKLLPSFDAAVDVFVLIEDETLRADSLRLIQQLRCSGKTAEYSLTPMKGDKQFKRALELKAKQTIRVERDATGSLQLRTKNLATREEQVCKMEALG